MKNNNSEGHYTNCDGFGHREYLQPTNMETYSTVDVKDESEHYYTALEIKNEETVLPSKVKAACTSGDMLYACLSSRAKLYSSAAWLLAGIVFGALCSGIAVYHLSKCNPNNLKNASEMEGDNVTELTVENITPVYNENHTYDYSEYLAPDYYEHSGDYEQDYSYMSTTDNAFPQWELPFVTPPWEVNVSLDSRKVTIICVDDEKMWHYDASWNCDYVSARWQPVDEFVQFMFELQTDGSYKIKSIGGGVYLFDGYGVPGSNYFTLNGKDHQDDDHARFLVTMVMEGRYRIQTKATQRFLRLDENLMVSSLKNSDDERALFKFTEV